MQYGPLPPTICSTDYDQGYNIANNTEKSCWDFMEESSTRAKQFGDAMSLFSFSPAYSPGPLINYMNDETITKGILVDVGGSHGAFSLPIVNRFPDIRCIVQDRPEVIANVYKHVSPDDLAKLDGRIEFMSHDFFTSQPIHGAEVYLLRWILHDWSDEYAIRILRALVPALKNGSRVLIHEYIVPEPGEATYLRQQNMRYVHYSHTSLI